MHSASRANSVSGGGSDLGTREIKVDGRKLVREPHLPHVPIQTPAIGLPGDKCDVARASSGARERRKCDTLNRKAARVEFQQASLIVVGSGNGQE